VEPHALAGSRSGLYASWASSHSIGEDALPSRRSWAKLSRSTSLVLVKLTGGVAATGAGDRFAPIELGGQIPGMPSPRSGNASLDLFHHERRVSPKETRPQALPPRLPSPEQLATLSDTDLSELTALLVEELQRRVSLAAGGEERIDLHRAISKIERLRPQPKSQPARRQGPSPILDGRRNAIRAALKAGLRPTQVAKHFGVSLRDVRQLAAQAD